MVSGHKELWKVFDVILELRLKRKGEVWLKWSIHMVGGKRLFLYVVYDTIYWTHSNVLNILYLTPESSLTEDILKFRFQSLNLPFLILNQPFMLFSSLCVLYFELSLWMSHRPIIGSLFSVCDFNKFIHSSSLSISGITHSSVSRLLDVRSWQREREDRGEHHWLVLIPTDPLITSLGG